ARYQREGAWVRTSASRSEPLSGPIRSRRRASTNPLRTSAGVISLSFRGFPSFPTRRQRWGAAPMRFRRVVMLRDSQPFAGTPDGVMQGLFQQFARRQLRQVLRDPDAALVELELDRYQPAKAAVVEEQVQVIIHAVDRDALLPRDEREVGAQLKDECLQLAEDRRLDVLLGVRAGGQAEEVEEVRIAEYQVRRYPVLVPQRSDVAGDHLVGLLAERRPFVEEVSDLVPERPHAPPLDAAHLGVEVAFESILKRDQFDEVAPGQFSRQRCDNFPIWETLGKLDHPTEPLLRVAPAKLRRQLSRQRRDYL